MTRPRDPAGRFLPAWHVRSRPWLPASDPRRDAYTARNAVATLRAAGLDITGEPCREHGHRSSVRRYRLVEAPRQMDLLGAGRREGVMA